MGFSNQIKQKHKSQATVPNEISIVDEFGIQLVKVVNCQ